jgi:hypothetical protein
VIVLLKVGDLVKIVHTGEGYIGYKGMFDYAVEKYNLKNVYFEYGGAYDEWKQGNLLRVIALTSHLADGYPLTLIANPEGRVFVYGNNGLQVIE